MAVLKGWLKGQRRPPRRETPDSRAEQSLKYDAYIRANVNDSPAGGKRS